MIVLESVQSVAEQSQHVRVDPAAIQRWAATVTPDDLRPTGHELPTWLPGTRAQLANLTLLIDALNFCFWSDDPLKVEWRGRTYHRFEAMFVAIMLAAKHDPRWFDARHWVNASSAEIQDLLCGKGTLLLMEERERIIRETGQTLLERFDGQFANAVESVNDRAWPLAVLLMTNFDSFRDVSPYRDRPVYLLKRAQICALDLSVAWNTHDHSALSGLEELTAFADYRVPQALRHLGILNYQPELAERIDRDQELPANGEQEVEIRAMTVWAVEQMGAALAQGGRPTPAWQIDWYLWVLSHRPEVVGHHHRTRTINY